MLTYILTHGHTRYGRRSPLYSVWQSVIYRTTDPRSKNWPDYGGRGIFSDPRWHVGPSTGFELFAADFNWDRPKDERGYLTLDRIDNDGPYIKSNCRWATKAEQRRNQRLFQKSGRRNGLTQQAVIDIIVGYLVVKEPMHVLAQRYGTTVKTVSRLVAGKDWQDIHALACAMIATERYYGLIP